MKLVRYRVILQIGVGQDDKLTKKMIFFFKGSKWLTMDISQKGWLERLKRDNDSLSIVFEGSK